MSTWSEERAKPADNRPRRWLAESTLTGWPSADPEVRDETLELATDGQLANLLNLYGWPVVPSWRTDTLGAWTGGTHWP